MGIKIKQCYSQIISAENLYRSAHQTTLKGLRFKQKGAEWKWQMERHIYKLHLELSSGKYKHGKYQSFTIYDPKRRTILAAQIKDRVVHHAINNCIEPIIDRKFIYDSYACRTGKGQHLAMLKARRHVQATTYYIHLDVKKFFYNIHRATLFQIISNTIKDEKALFLIQEILDSSVRHAHYKPNSPFVRDLFTQSLDILPYNASGFPDQERGIPIGNLCSQLFANWYLHELDVFVKHILKQKRYIRYMDDLVLFGSDKFQLRKCEEEITAFAKERLKLILHPSGGAKHCSTGLTFLGFQIFRTHIKVKSESVKRFRRKLKMFLNEADKTSVESFFNVLSRAQSWSAHASHADSFGLRKEIFMKHPWTEYMFNHNFSEKRIKEKIYG